MPSPVEPYCIQLKYNVIYGCSLVLSGADDVCVYSIGGGNGNGNEKNSSRGKNAQLTCWNSSQVTASEWIDNDNFIIGEASGMITIDKANQDYFRQVQYTQYCFIRNAFIRNST